MRNLIKNNIYFALFLLILSIQLSVVGFLYYSFKKESKILFTERISHLENMLNRHLAEPLEQSDISKINTHIQDISDDSNILSVEVLDLDHKTLIKISKDLFEDQVPQRKIEIPIFSLNNKNQILGYVHINYNTKTFETLITRNLILSITVSFILINLIGLVIFLFSRIIWSLEERLGHSAKLAAIGQMAATIAHEVKNPLTIISGETWKIKKVLDKEGVLNPKLEQSLDNQIFAVERIVSIVDSIRGYSRFEKKDRNSFISVKNLLKTLKSTVEHLLMKKNIQIKYDIDPKVCTNDVLLKGEEGKLYQVFVNLINNSRDAIVHEHGKITLRCYLKHKKIHFEIIDNGHGIKEDQIAKIFNPFYTTKSQAEGTGIGLDVVNSIIIEMGGKITVNSTPGKETIFHIELDVDTISSENKEILTTNLNDENLVPHHPLDKGISQKLKAKGQKHILLAEDEELISEVVQETFESFDYKVTVVNNGHDAYKLIKKDPTQFDILITDLNMPIMTGQELIHTIEVESLKDFLIIVYSGHVTILEEELQNYGINFAKMVDGVLNKPFNIKDIEDIIQSFQKNT